MSRRPGELEVEIGVDSCASTTVCPIGFGGSAAKIHQSKIGQRPLLHAGGDAVEKSGAKRIIPIWFTKEVSKDIEFEEAGVRRPLFAVS